MQNCSAFRHLLLRRLFSTQIKKQTYYEILNLNKDCNSRDIRNAYVELTKKFHPDVSGDASNSTFVKISEAYNVLRNPHMRAEYDQQLLMQGRPFTSASGTRTTEIHRPWEIKPDYNANAAPYYGFNGLRRVSNSKIAIILLLMGIIFSIVGFSSIRSSFALNQTELDKKSSEASSHHANVRANAEKHGNEEQLKRMVERMLNKNTGLYKKTTTE